MIVCLDVHYRDVGACAAGVVFRVWEDAGAAEERIVEIAAVLPYEAGSFYRRELPCLRAVLEKLPPPQVVVIDGYVWLDGGNRPGLGAHLHEALAGQGAVIGVAKTKYQGADQAIEVTRGTSRRPLYVTAIGMPVEQAAERVRSMHGANRIPTLLARVDALCRRGSKTL